ncbi:MAG: valine--tRNA ligase [Deltaproteobacteria bacterium]|jgi:valyl-tRNA synthetase|nr:valine--tRNA ligase [Deltaproteobacteria bacterium]
MSINEMAKAYDPKVAESKWYEFWEKNGYFHAPDKPEGKTYCIVIPPPNVTGALHMGHALNNTLQDILIRWKRMDGFAALWQPGTDHAGIATQNVVERQLLKEEGKKRQEIGREALIERIWKWREEYGDRILMQLRAMGACCDWERTRFTLDEGLSKAVRECFVRLFDEGLIYRGKYIVNWCPRCHTALADDEVDHKDEAGHLWHIKYPYAEGDGHVIVATTRPETLLGDTAVAVNPKDERYTDLIGKMLKLPETGREIPVLEDDFVDASFGSGAVKVTPAHDPNDFQIGERHNLPRINIMNEEAVMNEEAGEKYKGMTRDDCRKKIVKELEKQNLIEKIEDHAHAVGHCYRCKTTIEPWLSDQWFVKMRPLAENAIRASEEGKVKFHPKRWNQFYMQWLENARDWCISRQIWWGHRIPVWYCSNEQCPPIVSRENPSKCPHCENTDITQDEDVLDTWFSSALWPFSTLGWPEKTPELEAYYPTNTLSTDRGIIYFWVARMVMMGLKMVNEVPFSDVYIHGTILDDQGRKMSKSLGNGIDPLDIIEKYGADAMRFSLVVLSTEGQDLKLSESKFEMGRNFCNKLWNATRFAMMNLEGAPDDAKDKDRTLADKWILNRLQTTINSLRESMDDYKFSLAAQTLYHFIWNDFCDWYLEATKLAMSGDADPKKKAASQATLKYVLNQSIKLLHPFLPFITEELWQNLNPDSKSIMIAEYPTSSKKLPFEDESSHFNIAQDIISAIRNVRGEHNVKPGQKINAIVKAPDKKHTGILESCRSYITFLSRLDNLDIGVDVEVPKQAATQVTGNIEVHIPYAGLIDVAAEKARLEKEIKKSEGEMEGIRNKLGNEAFISRAPKDIVDREKERLAAGEDKIAKLNDALKKLDQ